MAELPRGIMPLLRARRVERVEPNREHAEDVIDMAERHVETARALSGMGDPAMAFTAAYDGARKALAAVLALHGLRVRPAGGAHHNTGVAAAVFVTDPALREFEWMRQLRNATEYPSADHPGANERDVAEGIEAAEGIVAACAEYVRTPGRV